LFSQISHCIEIVEKYRIKEWSIVFAAEDGIMITLTDMINKRTEGIAMDTIPAADAKTNFGALLDKAQRKPLTISRNGRAVAPVAGCRIFRNLGYRLARRISSSCNCDVTISKPESPSTIDYIRLSMRGD
jgi:prevent-host-death family protein